MVIAKDWQSVPASTTATIKGQSGKGCQYDIIEGILITPTNVVQGGVTLHDTGGNSIEILAAGTLSDLKPFYAKLGAKSTQGAWSITTGAAVIATAFGRFN